ncbi:MAG: hypothetical protein ACOCP8_00690, partial [archaeon]
LIMGKGNEAITNSANNRFAGIEQKLKKQQKEQKEQKDIVNLNTKKEEKVKDKIETEKNKNITIAEMMLIINDSEKGNDKTLKNFSMTEKHALKVDLMAAIDPNKNKSEIIMAAIDAYWNTNFS